MCFVWISEQTAIFTLYNIFITETESIYCAVRIGSLNERDYRFVLKGLTNLIS